MRKSLLLIWFISLVVLGIGTVFYPNNAAFWLASDANHIMILRGLLGTLLLIQIVTQPPRNVWFRYFAGGTASLVAIWAIQATVGFDIQLLDALAFIGSSMAVGMTALEHTDAEEPVSSTVLAARS